MSGHVREFEADDGVVDEFGVEGSSFVGVFHGFFVADAGEAEAFDYYADAFMVEVGHDNWMSVSDEDLRSGWEMCL